MGLNCFFSNQYANRGDLFEGLSIWQEEKYRNLQGTYPVIFLSFADVKGTNAKDAIQKMKNIFVDLYLQYEFLEEKLSKREKLRYQQVHYEMSDVATQDALKNLSALLPQSGIRRRSSGNRASPLQRNRRRKW